MMDFYKKNPKIEGNITVQGVLMDNNQVVCGEEFKPFADEETFPGWTPSLVVVDFSKLPALQQTQAAEFAVQQGQKPPKVLGVIRSDSFSVNDQGDVKIANVPDQPKKIEHITEPPIEAIPKIEISTKKKPAQVDEYSPQELVDLLPGVTGMNVKKMIKSSKTFEELATASNVVLRKMGIAPSFYGRFREKAEELSKKGK